MTLKLTVPYKTIAGLNGKDLEVHHPARCSRCNSDTADFFATYSTVFQAEKIKHKQIGQKYRIKIKYRLRLPLCEDCYKADFLLSPDDCAKDDTPQGKIAHRFSLGLSIGAIFAAAGFLLETGLIPETATTAGIKSYWWLPAGIGLLIVTVVWFFQHQEQAKIKKELEAKNFDFSHSVRAELRSTIIDEQPGDEDAALEIIMPNESWANEFAQEYQLKTAQFEQ